MEDSTPRNGTRGLVFPRKVILGTGAVKEVNKYVEHYGTKPHIIASEEIYDIHEIKVKDNLTDNGIDPVIYTGVRSDPTMKNIAKAYDLWQTEEHDIIIT